MLTKDELKAEWEEAEAALRAAGKAVGEAEAALRSARDVADQARLNYESAISDSTNAS